METNEPMYLVEKGWVDALKEADAVDTIRLVRALKEGQVDIRDYPNFTDEEDRHEYHHDGTQVDEGIIDWSKAPQGTTHCYSNCYRKQSTPTGEGYRWERWDRGLVEDWTGDDNWEHHCDLEDVERRDRVRRPQ